MISRQRLRPSARLSAPVSVPPAASTTSDEPSWLAAIAAPAASCFTANIPPAIAAESIVVAQHAVGLPDFQRPDAAATVGRDRNAAPIRGRDRSKELLRPSRVPMDPVAGEDPDQFGADHQRFRIPRVDQGPLDFIAKIVVPDEFAGARAQPVEVSARVERR